MAPRITPEFYEQGRALYQAGGTLLQLHETMVGIEAQERAAEEANLEAPSPERDESIDKIRERFRWAEPSLTMGFAEGFIADLRRSLASRGQRA